MYTKCFFRIVLLLLNVEQYFAVLIFCVVVIKYRANVESGDGKTVLGFDGRVKRVKSFMEGCFCPVS